MKLLRVFPGKSGVSNHRLMMRLGQSARLAHAVAFNDMFYKGNDLVFGKTRIEENGAAMFGKLLLTDQAQEEASLLFVTVPGADTDVFSTTNAIFGTFFILTTKLLQVVHDCNWEKETTKTKRVTRNSEE